MVDQLTPSARSALMSRIRGKNTKPELVVRSTLHRLGYRYTLHPAHIPGHPDLTFPARSKVIFVHGCFWHGHDCAHGRRRPGSNVEFWERKYRENRSRDARKQAALKVLGWNVLVVWECEVKANRWLPRARRFLQMP
jgi:DNA mismatch endonuclease (patch repair protein)